MRSEIAEIPAVFQKLSDQIPTITKQVEALALTNIDSVILVARGTSDNAALFLKYLIETKIGIPCGLASPSVVTIYKSELKFTNCLVIGLSQSGQSPDIVTYTKAAKAGGAKSISLTNDPESPLAKVTDLIPGMALAIEPMITRGTEKTKVLSDDWTVVSQDHSRGAHFEHTYAIAPDGKPFVLTAIDGGEAQLGRLGIEISDLL